MYLSFSLALFCSRLKFKNASVHRTGAFFVVSSLMLSSLVAAQAPVVSLEAVPPESPANNSSLQALVEIQSLREEISSLRGIIEGLEYKVGKLERQQNENYQDLDSRISALYQGELPVSNAVTQTSDQSATTQETSVQLASAEQSNPSELGVQNVTQAVGDTARETVGIIPLSEFDVSSSGASAESKLIYERGFAALRKGQREAAITEFQAIVDNYPASSEMADSLYWLGETYWLANKREESRQSFVQLLESYPNYRKSGDAMYRLGIIYDQLGDKGKALDYMNQVLSSGSSQVSAAQTWINENASVTN